MANTIKNKRKKNKSRQKPSTKNIALKINRCKTENDPINVEFTTKIV